MKNLVIGCCFMSLGLAPLAGSAEEALLWCFNDPYMTSWQYSRVKAKDAVDLEGNPYNMKCSLPAPIGSPRAIGRRFSSIAILWNRWMLA